VNEAVLASARKLCYAERDKYFACLADNDKENNACKEVRKEFEKTCPAIWVIHFEKRREEKIRLKRILEERSRKQNI